MNYFIVIVNGSNQIGETPEGLTISEVAASYDIYDPSLYAEFLYSDFDPACYSFPDAFALSGGVVSFNLSDAKVQASGLEKAKFAALEQAATDGYSANQLASQGALPEIDRLPEIQVVIDAVNVLAVELSANLAAIDSATDINEVNDVVNPPTGVLFTGRGSGLGPEDLNVSYYTEFNSLSLPESDTELYVPGTSTVIAYGSGGPGQFDSMGNCFNPGDYLIQIRNSKTGFVIAEFEVPLNPAGEGVAF